MAEPRVVQVTAVADAIMEDNGRLFCFDEFNVTDIGDAMILRVLLEVRCVPQGEGTAAPGLFMCSMTGRAAAVATVWGIASGRSRTRVGRGRHASAGKAGVWA